MGRQTDAWQFHIPNPSYVTG